MKSANCEKVIISDLQMIYESSYNISSISQSGETLLILLITLGHNKRRNKRERGSRCRLISGLVTGVKTDGVVNLALECKCISLMLYLLAITAYIN